MGVGLHLCRREYLELGRQNLISHYYVHRYIAVISSVSSLAWHYTWTKKNPCLSFSFYRPDYSEYNALELSKSLFETLQIFLEKFNMEGIKDAEASLHKTWRHEVWGGLMMQFSFSRWYFTPWIIQQNVYQQIRWIGPDHFHASNGVLHPVLYLI